MCLTHSIGVQARQCRDTSHNAFNDRGATVADAELMCAIHRREEGQIHALQLGVSTQKHPIAVSLCA